MMSNIEYLDTKNKVKKRLKCKRVANYRSNLLLCHHWPNFLVKKICIKSKMEAMTL